MSDYKSKISSIESMFELAKDEKNKSDVVIVCRQVLEKIIDLIFEYENIRKPFNASLLELINNDTVKSFIDNDVIIDSMHFVRIVGNNALHDKHIKPKQADVALDNIEFLLSFVSEKLVSSDLKTTLIVSVSSSSNQTPSHMTEAKTRKIYIDTYLEEAGWQISEAETNYTLPSGAKVKAGNVYPGKACCEIPVTGMQNASGVGFCDYVLYGKDGKPLAIVEAKKTSVQAIVGQQQVREYGECMRKQYGYVPILYCTNGYETYVIDGKYPQRKVNGFHTMNELSYLLKSREINQIVDMTIKDSISGRPYQKMAITKICERFNEKQRKGLLVMATGTGKTRVSISLVDVLTRNNWVKNVLFLADRTSLVAQAFTNFSKLMPDMTYCVLSDKSRANEPNARITFSTHQTMINIIDSEDKGEYTIGRFDLIIIDEAHRSIFNKYGAIFDYFDSLLVGLTATPKDEVDSNTYQLFNCENGTPNFAYSLEEAVRDKYLVPYKVVNKTTKLVKDGIKYSDLTAQEKIAVDLAMDEDYQDDDIISGSKLFKKIYNKDTCRQVLEDLMTRGLKIDYGQTLGKTIIFAVNHKHAEMIVDTFNDLYPAYAVEGYCKLIDNQIKNSQHLIEQFETDSKFRIAVSVDMLDTGIDVPAVLNLVFFKQVRSKIKFMQMIGRGTRLCENLVDGKDKSHFLIFDYCGNFEYFEEHVDGSDGYKGMSVTQKIFEQRLNMLVELQKVEHQLETFKHNYYKEIKDILFKQVINIKKSKNKISVKERMGMVDKYCEPSTWMSLTKLQHKEIMYFLLPTIDSEIKEHPMTLSFDLKMLRIENALLELDSLDSVNHIIRNVREMAKLLLQRGGIEEILQKATYLQNLYNGDLWTKASLEDIEFHRKKVREIMKFIPIDPRYIAFTDVEDETIDLEFNGKVMDIRTYQEKVMDYLIENSNNPTINKIKHIEPLNEDDFKELENILWVQTGTKEDYYKFTKIDNLAVFIRSIVGIEQEAVNEKFGEFLNDNYLTSEQQEFIYSIINYVRENGDIDVNVIVEDAPFNNYDFLDLFGDKVAVVGNVVKTIHNCIE